MAVLTHLLSYIDGWQLGIVLFMIHNQQDLTQTPTSVCSGILTALFTYPIVSSDNTYDVDLDVCQFVAWVYNRNVSNFTSPITIKSKDIHLVHLIFMFVCHTIVKVSLYYVKQQYAK